MNKVIVFPTDTVYGIGCSAFDKDSIERIYTIKKRDRSKPLAVLCQNIEQIKQIAHISEKALKLVQKYLPGALTIILEAKDNIKQSMKIDSVGVRIPNHRLALEILGEYGPLATTSVNESGKKEINEYETIYNDYKDLVDYIYKPTNEVLSEISSTVIMILDDKIKLIREGQIPFEEILKIYE